MAKIKPKDKGKPSIPDSSLSDIVFILLIFFMVSTVFVTERGFQVLLPLAEERVKVPKQDVTHLYVERRMNGDAHINIDDADYPLESIEGILIKKIEENPVLVVSFKTDKRTDFGLMREVLETCKKANALNVIFAADAEL